jgi:hypothetical protein
VLGDELCTIVTYRFGLLWLMIETHFLFQQSQLILSSTYVLAGLGGCGLPGLGRRRITIDAVGSIIRVVGGHVVGLWLIFLWFLVSVVRVLGLINVIFTIVVRVLVIGLVGWLSTWIGIGVL